MKIVAAADLHGHLPEIDPCDLLLLGGDLCPLEDHSLDAQAAFLAGPFADWLDRLPCGRVVGVAGNHDFIFEQLPEAVPPGLKWTYLQDAATEIDGLTIYGTPWQPMFGTWAFNAHEPALIQRWAAIPAATDALLLHGPPPGYGDKTLSGRSTGSPSLLEAIDRVSPKLVVAGHIHEGRGRWNRGRTTIANASLRDAKYQVVHEPMLFNLRWSRHAR